MYDKPITSIIFNEQKVKAFPLISRTRQDVPFYYSLLFLRDFIYLFLERGREGEREEEEHQCVVASCMPPTGDLAHNPGTCPRLGIEPATFWFAGRHSIY